MNQKCFQYNSNSLFFQFPFVNEKFLANVDFNLVDKPAVVVQSEALPDASIRYDEFLLKGEDIFKLAMENSSVTHPSTDEQLKFIDNVKANELRWFLFPNEVNNELCPDKLKVPFTPRLYATTPTEYQLEHYSTITAGSSLTRLSVGKFNSKVELSIPKGRKCFPGTS